MTVRAAIVGSGNIGTDLMYKLLRSEHVEPVWMVGIERDSEGLSRAREQGLKTTHEGIEGLIPHVEEDGVRLAFDATSAYAHQQNVRQLNEARVVVVDLTPAALGPFCVPVVNIEAHVNKREMDVNMVSCGGQATIPIVAAVSAVQPVEYAEIVATVASKSAGPGTRKNIDEFTRTTARGLEAVGGAKRGKAIIILNPAEPPLIMRDTIHCLTVDEPRAEEVRASVERMVDRVQEYVPGYRLKHDIVIDGNRVSVFAEIKGLGDFLPEYAGNLDIMTSAAAQTGDIVAQGIEKGIYDEPAQVSV